MLTMDWQDHELNKIAPGIPFPDHLNQLEYIRKVNERIANMQCPNDGKRLQDARCIECGFKYVAGISAE